MSTQPPSLGGPRISLDPNLENFSSTNINDVLWNNIQLQVPVPPIIQDLVAPSVPEPEEPSPPEIELDSIPDLSFFKTELDSLETRVVEIPLPRGVEFKEWEEESLRFEGSVPSKEIEWDYGSIDHSLADLLSSVYEEFSLESPYEGRIRQHSLWDREIDPANLVGIPNSYEGLYNKYLDRGKNSLERLLGIVEEKFSIILKETLLERGQSFEGVQLDSFLNKQGLLLAKVSSSLDLSLEKYNSFLQKFSVEIEAYQQIARVHLGELELRELLIREHGEKVRTAELAKEANRLYLQWIGQEVQLQVSQARLFRAQMDLARKKLNLQLLQSDVRRSEIEALAALTRARISEVSQDIALNEAEISKEKLQNIEPFTERLQADLEFAQTELEAAQKEFEAAREAFDLRQGNQQRLFETFPEEVKAQERNVNASIIQTQQWANLFSSQALSQINDAIALRNRNELSYEGDVRSEEIRAELSIQVAEARSRLAQARVTARESLANVEIAAETALAEANIQNNLNHEISVG